MDDVLINKIASVKRCVARAHEEFSVGKEEFTTNYSVQDACILNIIRACEQSLDIANYCIKKLNLEVPQFSADCFNIICEKGIIDQTLCNSLCKMVSFRNLIVHQYQKTDINIVISVIENNLDDLIKYTKIISTKF